MRGLDVFQHFNGDLSGVQNVFQGARRSSTTTVNRDNGIALRITEMAYQQMTTTLTHINETQPVQFLQLLTRREAGKWRH